jgi:hypothetical protein
LLGVAHRTFAGQKLLVSLPPKKTLKITAMAIPIRSTPVLEGELARRFIREAKANEKRRGMYKISDEDRLAAREIWTEYVKNFCL